VNALAAFDSGAMTTRDDPSAGQLDVGLMRLCGRDLAVPADNVREVVPLPRQLHPSFSGSGASTGSIVIRGRVIPVVDIAPLLGFGPRGDGPGVALILRHRKALIGVIMDSVSGLARIQRDAVQQFGADADPERVVSSSFPFGDTLVGLIDPEAVFALPKVPHAHEPASMHQSAAGGVRSAAVLFTVAKSNLAIDASLVVATVPAAHLRPSPAPASKWTGVVQYLGQEVPVVDDLSLLGLEGRAADRASGAVILLRLDTDRLLGLRIDQVQRILPIGATSVHPLPEALAGQLPLFRGAVVDHEGRQNLLLDRDALIADKELQMIGALSRARQQADARTAAASQTSGAVETRQPYLVFRAGAALRAAPLDSVRQIIPFAEAASAVRRSGSALQGIASYNGAPLPLLDLGSVAETRSDAVILVIEAKGAFTGLVVDKLETIARATPQRRPQHSGSFIQAMLGSQGKAVNVCDLAEEARLRA
jgi:purine-binding chemotaxis protein CheW